MREEVSSSVTKKESRTGHGRRPLIETGVEGMYLNHYTYQSTQIADPHRTTLSRPLSMPLPQSAASFSATYTKLVQVSPQDTASVAIHSLPPASRSWTKISPYPSNFLTQRVHLNHQDGSQTPTLHLSYTGVGGSSWRKGRHLGSHQYVLGAAHAAFSHFSH